MVFGQLVLGPPGSGKTTYCTGVQQWYQEEGKRLPILINLDPANDILPYEAHISITDLISITEAMRLNNLGPNGGVMYCIHYLELHFEWLEKQLAPYLEDESCYLIFDIPGQAELFTHDPALRRIIQRLQKLDIRLATINLVDSGYCTDHAKFISGLLLSLHIMASIELPHINVLSKIDLLPPQDQLRFPLDYYLSVSNYNRLSDSVEEEIAERNPHAQTSKYAALNKAITGLLEDFSMVGFYPLAIEDKELMAVLTQAIDRANGFVFGGLQEGNESIMHSAVKSDTLLEEHLWKIQEDYMNKTAP